MRLEIELNGKPGQIAVDQLRSIDKSRLLSKAGKLNSTEINRLKAVLKEYLID